MISPKSLLALLLATSAATPAFAQTPGSFADGGDTLVSAMMMFLGNEEKIYIIDKSENNAVQLNGHPAWASRWDIATHQAETMEVPSNPFCASGMHLPNGSYVTFGGNDARGPGATAGSISNGDGGGAWDATYQDFDGARGIRILNPCGSADNFADPKCQWFDNSTQLGLQRKRWYSAAEALADGSVVVIGGFKHGGYINRHTPNLNPGGDTAEPTYEFYPANGRQPVQMQFMITTSGLNAYAHTFLMPSGLMFVQANHSTILWDYTKNNEIPLPDMPNGVVRVYPASGATAMLPLTPANNWTPTMLFCGGSAISDDAYGNDGGPQVDTWDYAASQDCQRITPEPQDKSAPVYTADDDMLEPRTMGQFIALPDGTMLLINGGTNGTAGYSLGTQQTPNLADMPFGPSLATGPVFTPVIYNPNAAKGSRWSNAGLGASKIPRLYHSSAMLLPDGSILVAGSNPNPDVNLTTIYATEYRADIFYPAYFSAKVRPQPTGIPKTISYGGAYFNISVPASGYTGASNAAAANTTVVLIRGGFTTHAMNMGQRFVQLNSTYTVQNDGTIVLHVSQAPPNANLLQPGPAMLFVVVNGIPSKGSMLIVGSGQIGAQQINPAAALPATSGSDNAHGTADGSSNSSSSGGSGSSTSGKLSTTTLIAGIVGAVALLAVGGALIGICMARRRRAAGKQADSSFVMTSTGLAAAGPGFSQRRPNLTRDDSSSVMVPLTLGRQSNWDASTASLADSVPYRDQASPGLPPTLFGGTPQGSIHNGSIRGSMMEGYAPVAHALPSPGPRYADLDTPRSSMYGNPNHAPPSPGPRTEEFNPYNIRD